MINTNNSDRFYSYATFELFGVSLRYTEIAALVGVKMNTIQKRVSAGTPLFAMRLRRVRGCDPLVEEDAV